MSFVIVMCGGDGDGDCDMKLSLYVTIILYWSSHTWYLIQCCTHCIGGGDCGLAQLHIILVTALCCGDRDCDMDQ